AEAELLNYVAAIPITQFYLPKTPENHNSLITDEDFRDYWTGRRHAHGQSTAAALAMAWQKRFFHWFLEFPEIVDGGGFDCILGNPPYLGGQDLSGTYGHPFCRYVKWEYAPAGLSDLVVYFVRRIYSLLRPGGFTAFITTNSIKDGDVRKDGLEQVLEQGATINFAVRGIKWPGRANLVVSLVALYKGGWKGKRMLDGREVPVISAYFEDSEDITKVSNLSENYDRIFMGTIFLGDGFILSEQEASFFLKKPNNKEVIFPLLNGQEINSDPQQKPSRFIICLEKCKTLDSAAKYPELLERLQEKVLPDRLAQKNERAKKLWWRYYRYNQECYAMLQSIGTCFVAARTTKHLAFSRVKSGKIFTDAVYIFTTDRWDLYAVVQSTLHEVWARKYSGALETRLRYSPS